jgi:hypothetical protein
MLVRLDNHKWQFFEGLDNSNTVQRLERNSSEVLVAHYISESNMGLIINTTKYTGQLLLVHSLYH